jgi:hypothetical protein
VTEGARPHARWDIPGDDVSVKPHSQMNRVSLVPQCSTAADHPGLAGYASPFGDARDGAFLTR